MGIGAPASFEYWWSPLAAAVRFRLSPPSLFFRLVTVYSLRMLDMLVDLVRSGTLYDLLVKSPGVWKSLDVTYEEPRVRRLWTTLGSGGRVSLHQIFPCEKPFFHPHVWPSAILLLKGYQEMALAHAPWNQRPPPEPAHRVTLAPWSYYEMLTPNEWHSVRPLRDPSYSVMLSGKPFEGVASEKGSGKNPPLADEAVEDLRTVFGNLLLPDP